jgi:diguanylate cyclase (GGDEF)-like protein/PAS domain S-box-containing protein
MLSQTLQGRFLLIVLPILIVTIGVVGYSQYLVYTESSRNLEQNSSNNQIILQTKRVKEALQDLELNLHRDVILAPPYTPAISQDMMKKNERLQLAFQQMQMRLHETPTFGPNLDQILNLTNKLGVELSDLGKQFANYPAWRGDRDVVTEKLQAYFTEARQLLNEIEVQERNYAERFLMESHKVVYRISYLMWFSLFVIIAIIVIGYVVFEVMVRRPVLQVASALNAEAAGKESVLPTGDIKSLENKLLVDAFNNMREQVTSRQLRLEAVLDHAAEGIITYDEDRIIESLNKAAEKLFGYSEDEVVGKKLDMLFSSNMFDNASINFQYLLTPEKINEEEDKKVDINACRKDGNVFQSVIKISSYLLNGKTRFTAIVEDVSEHKAMIENLRRLAEHDGLTGLYNRYYFMQEVEHLVDRVARQSTPTTALLYLDLDNFKYVNDTLGHIAGDELLVQITLILQKRSRRSDLLARIGGDEFAMILYDVNEAQAIEVAEMFRQNIHDYKFMYQGETVDIGCSLGVVMVKPRTSTEDLIAWADYSCHAAKLAGKNKIHLYTKDDQKDIIGLYDDIGWTRRIKQALEDDMFVIACQPIKDPAGETRHFEILLRMQDEEGNIIMPSGFIPPAERFGLMPSIDRWVIHHAVLLLKYASKFTPELSVNLSAASFRDDSIIDYITEKIQETNIEANRLTFEITETIAMSDLSMTAHNLQRLQELGCQTSLDDFGAGYASYAYLKDLPVHFVKIDGSFITGLVNNKLNREIVQSMHNIAHIMGKKTVAEFVENKETARILTDMGIDYLQGYYIGKPKITSFELDLPFSGAETD